VRNLNHGHPAIPVLKGQQSNYTKFLCFLREWDCKNCIKYWTLKHWPKRQYLESGTKNIIHHNLVKAQKNCITSFTHKVRYNEAICKDP